MKTYILNTSAEGILSGVWTAEPGTYHTTYASYEFVSLLEGEIEITPDGGKPTTFKGGDAFVVEHNFVGTWVIKSPVKKVSGYVLKRNDQHLIQLCHT
jgi:uncharacterized cupin superfamily protein